MSAATVTAAEVVGWFREAGVNPLPAEWAVSAVTHYINTARAAPPRPRYPNKQEFDELTTALATLGRVLPTLIEFGRKREREAENDPPGWRKIVTDRNAQLRALHMAVRAASASWPAPPAETKGKRRAPWKRRAKGGAAFVASALRLAGHREPIKFTAHDSPQVAALCRVLAAVEGFERKPTQVVEAFR